MLSHPLYWSLERISKSALLELVVDLARAEAGGLGEAPDEEIEEWVLRRFGPVANARGDRRPPPQIRQEVS